MEPNQLTADWSIPVADPLADAHNAVHADESERLCRQCYAVLDAFRDASANTITNAALKGIAIRYSARILTLRRAGYRIEIIHRDRKSGVNTYRMSNPDFRHATAR